MEKKKIKMDQHEEDLYDLLNDLSSLGVRHTIFDMMLSLDLWEDLPHTDIRVNTKEEKVLLTLKEFTKSKKIAHLTICFDFSTQQVDGMICCFGKKPLGEKGFVVPPTSLFVFQDLLINAISSEDENEREVYINSLWFNMYSYIRGLADWMLSQEK